MRLNCIAKNGGGNNILLDADGRLWLIDFAEAVLAPVWYEQALIAVELFGFDKALLRGYFGNYEPHSLAKLCLDGLLLHDFGGDLVARHIGDPHEFGAIGNLYRRILARL